MGNPNSIDSYNDPDNDPMEFNFQDIMSDQNPTLADLATPENSPSPQFAFDTEPNNEDLTGDHDPIFEELVRIMRESEAAGPSSSSLDQELTGNEHNFHGNNQLVVHNLNDQIGGGGVLVEPLQTLNNQDGGDTGGSVVGGLLPTLNPNQFENVSIQGGAGGGLLQQPLQRDQSSSLNTQGCGGSGSLLPQWQPIRFQLQPSQLSMRNNEASNDGGGLIGNQFARNFNSQSGGGGGLLPPMQLSQFRLQYNQLQMTNNETLGLIGTSSGSNLNAQGGGGMMPSQQSRMQIENSNSGSLLASGIGGTDANSQEAGPSNRNNRRHPTETGGINANNEWNISDCAPCQVIREINHTDGNKITKLEIHGGLCNINHIVTKTYEEHQETKYKCFGFAGMRLDTVKTFLQKYCDIRRNEGYIMLHDPFSEFYDTLSVELYRRPLSDHVSDDQPVSLSGDRRRSDGASGSGSGGGNEQNRRPGRSNLSRQRRGRERGN